YGQDGLDHNLGGRLGIASDRFRSLHADQAHGNSCSKCRQTYVQTSVHGFVPPFSPAPRLSTVRPAKVTISIVRGLRSLRLRLANQQREDGRQQHEDQRLNYTYKQLQKIKGNRYQPA